MDEGCENSMKKSNKYMDMVLDAMSIVEGHDMLVPKMRLTNDIYEHIEKEVEDGRIFSTKVTRMPGYRKIAVYSSLGPCIVLDTSVAFDRTAYHTPENCIFCAEEYYRRTGRPYMKKDQTKIEAVMRPGASSQAGFLNDDENLADVILVDNTVLKALDITYDQIADRMETVTGKARRLAFLEDNKGKDYWRVVEKGVLVGNLKISWVSYRGYQACPFGCEGQDALSDTDYTVTNTKTGKSIFFSKLHMHLLRRHQFFEGHTKYRLDPRACVEVLEVEPDKSYKPIYKSEEYWRMSQGSCSGDDTVQDYLDNLKKNNYYKDLLEVVEKGKKTILKRYLHVWTLGDKLLMISDKGVKGPFTIDGIELTDDGYGLRAYEKAVRKYIEP